MTVSFIYTPITQQITLSGGASYEVEALTQIFGEFPIKLKQKDIPQLQIMAVASRTELYKNIVNALNVYEAIMLEVVY